MTKPEDRCSFALPVLVFLIVAQPGSSSLHGNSQGASFDHPILEFEIAHPAQIAALAFSPDGQILAVATSSGALHLLEAKVGRTVKVPLRPVADMNRPSPWLSIAALSFSPDGRTLACGGGVITYGHTSSIEVRLWDIGSDRLAGRIVVDKRKADIDGTLRRLLGERVGRTHRFVHLNSIFFLPDGDRMLTVSRVVGGGLRNDGSDIVEWDLRTGKRNRRWPLDQVVSGAALAPDGTTLALACGNKIELWNIDTARVNCTVQDASFRGRLGVLSFAPDGRLIAAANGKAPTPPPGNPAGLPDYFLAIESVHIWKSEGTCFRRLKARQPGAVTAVSFSPDGRRIAVGCVTGLLRVYRIQ